MALINCPECNREISDKATSCPNCGLPINSQQQNTATPSNEEYLCCPKCGSKELHSDKKGFSGGKAFAGAVLTGGIGLLAGTIGSKDVQITCLKCGNKFKAGEAAVSKRKSNADYSAPSTYSNGSIVADDFDKELADKIKHEGMLRAIQFFKDRTGYDLASSKRHVEQFAQNNNIVPETKSGGCATVIMIAIVITGLTIWLV